MIKLDEHKYYKRLSGKGLKGVDFIATCPINGLAMIELKNYTQGKPSIPAELDLIMIAKRKDTIRLIKIVNQYFQRQLIFRIYKRFGLFGSPEWKIWMEALNHIEDGNYFFIGIVDY